MSSAGCLGLWSLQIQTQAENLSHSIHHTHKSNNFQATCMNYISFVLCSFELLTYCQILPLPYHSYFQKIQRL